MSVEDDAVLDQLVERIVAEAERTSPFCVWCMRGTDGEPLCSPICAEGWRKIMPPIGHALYGRRRTAIW